MTDDQRDEGVLGGEMTPIHQPSPLADGRAGQAVPSDADSPHRGESPDVPGGPTGPSGDLTAWFMGPKAENAGVWEQLIQYVFGDYVHWRRNYFPNDPVIVPRHRRRDHEDWQDLLGGHLDVLLNVLKGDFPFYHPRYLAHMLSEQTLPSVLGWFAGMLYNPNNVTEEAAPVTVDLELQVGRIVAEMLGFKPSSAWAHITSGGTIANFEALWIARTVQFTPFALRDLCRDQRWDFQIKLPSGRRRPLRQLHDDAILLRLAPNEAIYMPRQLQRYLVDERGTAPATAGRLIEKTLRESDWNVGRVGFHAIAARLGKRPVVLAPATAHYSIAKACNLSGYGEQAVRVVPVDGRFRMDVKELERMIRELREDEYLAAVVAVVGSTEEGAVDPVHEIKFLRDRLSGRAEETARRPEDTSFWLHVDAAWGGYVSCLFRGHDALEKRRDHRGDLRTLALEYAEAIGASEEVFIDVGNVRRQRRKTRVFWNDKEVLAAYLAMAAADSITVDPHKLGYVPYPAGVVAFRNGIVTELVVQKANYIAEDGDRFTLDEPAAITGVGPFILEGSKPGAAAASCWLAHKSIPLTAQGHGRIIRETLLAAARLARYLDHHRHLYRQLEDELGSDEAAEPFSFTRLYEPDTNVVCFIVQPKAVQDGRLRDVDCGIERLNRLNLGIHERLGRPNELGGERLPYLHPFFVSRTRLEHTQYSSASMRPVLKRLGVSEGAYRTHGVFVLRSAVMNPHYRIAAHEAGKDYLMEFVKALHRAGREVIDAEPFRRTH